MNGGEHDMGMLMHHTWLKQQEEANKRKKTADPAETVADETESEYANVTARKTVNRRKPTKK